MSGPNAVVNGSPLTPGYVGIWGGNVGEIRGKSYCFPGALASYSWENNEDFLWSGHSHGCLSGKEKYGYFCNKSQIFKIFRYFLTKLKYKRNNFFRKIGEFLSWSNKNVGDYLCGWPPGVWGGVTTAYIGWDKGQDRGVYGKE